MDADTVSLVGRLESLSPCAPARQINRGGFQGRFPRRGEPNRVIVQFYDVVELPIFETGDGRIEIGHRAQRLTRVSTLSVRRQEIELLRRARMVGIYRICDGIARVQSV